MSRIGKQPVEIPQGVEVSVKGDITVTGPKGELHKPLPVGFDFAVNDGKVMITPTEHMLKLKNGAALWGLYRSLVEGMIKGVSTGFERMLEIEGVGYRAVIKGKDLELQLGYSHPIIVEAPEGISFKVDKNKILISGYDKQLVGHTAAIIRSKRPPEPYKGKGIRYEGEVVLRKAGKKATAVA